MKKLLLSALISLSTAGLTLAETCVGETDDTATIVEIVDFRLAEGTTAEQFLASAQFTMGYLCETDGFVRRGLSRDETGLWMDYVE